MPMLAMDLEIESEIEVVPCKMKFVERRYCTEPGWRLATCQEAEKNRTQLDFKEWRPARLLDGWIDRTSRLHIRNDFRRFLGYMLVIQIQPSANCSSGNSGPARSIYADVTLTDRGREVALLLCVYDWNYEVVYWLLNSWENRETFNPLDVREGNIPMKNRTTFVEMNTMLCNLGRIFDEEDRSPWKAESIELSRDSVQEVMVSIGKSCWDKLSQEHKKILPWKSFLAWIDRFTSDIRSQFSKVNFFQDIVYNRYRAVDNWDFLWSYISFHILVTIVRKSLSLLMEELDSEECQVGSRKDFIVSSAILYYLLESEECEAKRILVQGGKDAASHGSPRFRSNRHKETGNYHVLNKILIYAVKSDDSSLVSKVLDWGAQPQAKLGPDRESMAIYCAISNKSKEIVTSLFDKCDSKEELANAADGEGMTALHWACLHADVIIFEMVLEYGGRPDVPDKRGRLPLHYAVDGMDPNRFHIARILFDRCDANQADDEGMTPLHWVCRNAEVGTITIISQMEKSIKIKDKRGRLPLHYTVESRNESLVDELIYFDPGMATCKDNDGVSPLDMAVKEYIIKIMVKLLSFSEQPLQTYLDKVDAARLLREFASEGNVEVVKKLLESRADPLACDGLGKTALHYAAACEDDYKARKITKVILAKCTSEEEKKKWLAKKDNEGQTTLHVAAMKRHQRLCKKIWEINKEILQIKDAAGRVALYHAVGGQDDNPEIILFLLRCGGVDVESIVDHSGLTPLHVAASEDKMYIADALLKESKKPKVYVRAADVLGQTALHKAAKGRHADTVKVLLHWGAHPLLERDSDGRTALHCAVQNEPDDQAIAIAELLLNKCGSDEKKLLLLWASAAGLGTADQHLSDSPLKDFLLKQKKHFTEKVGKENNLLRTAACLGDIEMTKELLARGAQIRDINDLKWRSTLSEKDKHSVDTVCRQIQRIAEQGNDQPTTADYLGRSDFAHGLAALLLNPYLKPPITVGISGSWGMGKSSLMIQTEGILLKTAAQLALLPSEMTSSKMTSSSFPGFQNLEHSEKGKKKYYQIRTSLDLLLSDANSKNKFFQDRTTKEGGSSMKNKIEKWWMKIKNKNADTNRKAGDSLFKFLNQYEAKYHHIFQSLAAMDSSGMFIAKDQKSESEMDSPTEGSVPAILTVRYNAWKYRNESEALAGMAVEITKGMEGIMTDAQWLSTCLRNTWRKQKQVIWIEIIFPCLFAVLLAITFTWILWLVLDRYKIKESVQLKYASFPLTVVIMVWTLVKKVMSTVNPVSVQLMNYIKFPDHTEKLGYQERVISDIIFLKEEISKKPHFLCTAASYMWHFIKGSCIISLLSSKYRGEIMASSIPSANLRTIVFVDDLDRCQESVILQVLSAINLVLAVCEISVVLGMDKALIERAIMKKYGDKSLKNSKQLADKYLQKIIQLPLDLPEPNEVQSKNFLERQLGVFKIQTNEGRLISEADDDYTPEIDIAYKALFSAIDWESISEPNFKLIGSDPSIQEARNSETKEALPETQKAEDVAIDIQGAKGTKVGSSPQQTSNVEAPPQADAAEGDQVSGELIPIRELLFVRYSEGERDAFCYFQKMATEFRKLPREWKRLLTYHRLVWYIFIINNEAKHLDGWQVQLITWLFICWEFEENINILIQRWNRIHLLKTYKPKSESESESGPRGPSLRAIIEHCINKENWIIASNKEQLKLKECANDQTMSLRDANNARDHSERSEIARPENSVTVVNEKNDELEKALLMALDAFEKEKLEEMKEQVDALKKEMKGDALEKEMNKEMEEQLDAVEKEIKEEMKEKENNNEMKEQLDVVEKEIKEEMKEKEINQEMKEQLDAIEKEIEEEMKEQLNALEKELKEEIKDALEKEIKEEMKEIKDEMKERVDVLKKERKIKEDAIKKERKDKMKEEMKEQVDALKKNVKVEMKDKKDVLKIKTEDAFEKETKKEMKKRVDALKDEIEVEVFLRKIREKKKKPVDTFKKEIKDDAFNKKIGEDIKEQEDALNKERKEEMKEQVDALTKEMKEDALKEKIKEEMKEQLDVLKKEIKEEMKDKAESQETRKSNKTAEEKELNSQSWLRLKFALRKYDVSMAGIQAFQRFRFYCEAGHLPWPLPPEEEENEDS